jgi:hypothetical protein
MHPEELTMAGVQSVLVLLPTRRIVGTSGPVKVIVSSLIAAQPIGPLSQFLFFLCILYYFLQQELSVKGTNVSLIKYTRK